MQARGTIDDDMRQCGLALHSVILSGSAPVLQLLGAVGVPASSCLVHVLGHGAPLKEWAQQGGWRGTPLAQDTASGILVTALGILANGDARLLLDTALAGAAPGGTAA